MSPRRFRISGDEGVGLFEPPEVANPTFTRLEASQLERLRNLKGLSATTSDVLDELGWRLAVPADLLAPRHLGSRTAVGHALTLSYLPERATIARAYEGGDPPKLAHHVLYRLVVPGDVMVVDGMAVGQCSLMGSLAAAAAVRAGLSAAIVDAGIRDLDSIRSLGLPVWSRHVTPVSGKARAEATAVNRPICCGGVQVIPGDLVVADDSGVCFVPNEIAANVVERILEVSRLESDQLAQNVPASKTKA